MNLKERIKSLCKERGISMNKLEDELGFGKGYISKLGTSQPNASKLQKIADFFGVSLDYLISGETKENNYYLNEETAQAAQEIFENKDLKMLFDVQRDMSAEDLQALYGMALALKRKERGDID